MYWSVRREVWENRSIYIAPLAVAAVVVFGFFIAAIAALWANAVKLDPQPDKLAQPFNFVAVLMMATTFILAIFYCRCAAWRASRPQRSFLEVDAGFRCSTERGRQLRVARTCLRND